MPTTMLLPGHDVPISQRTMVRRLLPQRPRRMVGAWCFVDHFGPSDVSDGPGMDIAPHPHTGLQTVTWLVDGEIVHSDSLGSAQTIRGGQLNLMTAGHGIAHSEVSPVDHPPLMHGLQLWVALPDSARHGDPAFDHHPDLPVVQVAGASITVAVGDFYSVLSPARTFTPLLGADIRVVEPTVVPLPLREDFEYAVLAMTGSGTVDGQTVEPGSLLYLGSGRSTVELSASGGRFFLLGGEPFTEPLVMWWNFVGRTHEEIIEARQQWADGDPRFGPVPGYDGERLPAPGLPTTRLKARGRDGSSQ